MRCIENSPSLELRHGQTTIFVRRTKRHLNRFSRYSLTANKVWQWILFLTTAICSSVLLAAGGETVGLTKTYAGNIDYVATGASFRNAGNATDACTFVSPMASSVSLNIPAGAQILDAYLYYAGSADIDSTYITGTGTISLANQTALTLNGVAIASTAGFNDRDFNNLTGLGSGVVDFFGARRDVSNIVTGPGAYTLAGMVVHVEGEPDNRPATQTCLAAWALIVVFENPAIDQVRVINLFEGFKDFKNAQFDLSPRNFVVDPDTPTGKMTHLSFEGDETIFGTENFQLQIGSGPFSTMVNGLNPTDNQYNSTVTGPNLFDSNTTYGLDLDTYDISAELFEQANAFTATTRYNSGTDLVLLMAEVIAIDNKALADIEVFLSSPDVFQFPSSNQAQYLIQVRNNGDGTEVALSGAATGYLHVYDALPAGIEIDAATDITAPGWDCTATDFIDNKLICTYDLATLPGGKLNRSEYLPDIVVNADVTSGLSPVTNIAYASLCNGLIDSCTTFTGKHTDSNQFDPVNFFEESAINGLFDVMAKTSVNNNVDRDITPVISGTPSDLSASDLTVIDINGGRLEAGDSIRYTLRLQESAGVAAMNLVMTGLLDAQTTNLTFQPTLSCSALTLFEAGGVITITYPSLAANESCSVVYDVTVKPSAVAGSLINSTLEITHDNGANQSVTAPTLFVAGLASGAKILYLDDLNGAGFLTRSPPTVDSLVSLAPGTSKMLTLNPLLAGNLNIRAGIIPVSVWIEAENTGVYDLSATLHYQSGTLIGTSSSLSGVSMNSGSNGAQLLPFQITLDSAITDLGSGEDITLTITNSGGSLGNIKLHSQLNGIKSSVILDAVNVINVESIGFYSDSDRNNALVPPAHLIEAGHTVYIETVVSDPFGAFDITGANLTLVDPDLVEQVSEVTMTESSVSTIDGRKTYVYAYEIPPVTFVSPGLWAATITAAEGQEGVITHTEVNRFTTTVPAVDATYSVTPLFGDVGDVLTYSIVIHNAGTTSTTVAIAEAIPSGTTNLSNITVSGSATATVTPSSTDLVISNINLDGGASVTVTFSVEVSTSLSVGDLIDASISVDNMGTDVTATAPSVVISPFSIEGGNKPLYVDNLAASPSLDRTLPVIDTLRTVSSQGGTMTLTLAPVLQSGLTLAAGSIDLGLWISLDTSFGGERQIQATLGYTGASTGTIGTDTVTVNLLPGITGAQYLPLQIDLANDLPLLANSSLTLTLTNTTPVAGESVTLHSMKDAGVGDHSSLVSLNALEPLAVTAIEFFDNDIDSGGVQLDSAAENSSVWVRATVEDPFGAADITSARLFVTAPSLATPIIGEAMTIPSTQPDIGSQRFFQYALTSPTHNLNELGDWLFQVTAFEGTEALVSASRNVLLNVNNASVNLEDSYKTVANLTSGNNADTNPGDTLHYSINLLETGGKSPVNLVLTDTITTHVAYISGSLKVNGVAVSDPPSLPADLVLDELAVPALGSLTVEYDVIIKPATSVGTLISNRALISADGGVSEILDAEDLTISGVAAVGTKLLYLTQLDNGPLLTRARPNTASDTDFLVLNNLGGGANSVSLNLTPELAKAITLEAANGPINIALRMKTNGEANNRNRSMMVSLGYHAGLEVTTISSTTQNVSLDGNVATYNFSLPLITDLTIPAGNRLQLSVSNLQTNNNRDAELYSFDTAGSYSVVRLVPDPVINVDAISFHLDESGSGSLITNAEPGSVLYAQVTISDPFGQADIQSPVDPNPTQVFLSNPDNTIGAAVPLANCQAGDAPCFAFSSELEDGNPATRTFYYLIRTDSDPPATRGSWTLQVIAHEGLETAPLVSHAAAASFTTLSASNLSTSTKTARFSGDLNPSDTLTYTITLINSGALPANNLLVTDSLQQSPLSLNYSNAVTNCLDEASSPLLVTHSSGVVSLTNIFLGAGAQCNLVITTTVGNGTPGMLVNNTATIINPDGPGATPSAQTITLSQSQVPEAGSKQLYLGLNTLTRGTPGAFSTILTAGGGTNTLVLDQPIVRDLLLEAGPVDVKLYLGSSGVNDGKNRAIEVQLWVNDTLSDQLIGTATRTIALQSVLSLETFNLINAAPVELPAGSSIWLTVTNNQGRGRDAELAQIVPPINDYAQVVLPVLGSITVTQLKFFNQSATNNGGIAGCELDFSCASAIEPGQVASGPNSLWVQATIADAFGASDVNSNCVGATPMDCPTLTLTDPAATDQTPTINALTYVGDLLPAARLYEFEISAPSVMAGLEGIWTLQVTGSEGREQRVFDRGTATYEVLGQPSLTIATSVAGLVAPGEILTYQNRIQNTGFGTAKAVRLSNSLGAFLGLELTRPGINWTASYSLSGAYTVLSETFDDGLAQDFSYDPNTTGPCAGGAPSPCYDPAIREWQIELNEDIPAGGQLIQEYRTRIE